MFLQASTDRTEGLLLSTQGESVRAEAGFQGPRLLGGVGVIFGRNSTLPCPSYTLCALITER